MSRPLTATDPRATSDLPSSHDAPLVQAIAPPVPGAARFAAIDQVRGLVIAVMALDHVRDYFTIVRYPPTDLSRASAALFMTRWITHFCAPTFVFLAGVSAYLMGGRRTRVALSRFLLSRGLWLILLEATVVHFVWNFNLQYQSGLLLQVIWVIGASMCCLAALVWLPHWAIAGFAIVTIVGHNALDPIQPEQLGRWAPLWRVLHVPGKTPLGSLLYPLLPWVGVMAAGYAFGARYAAPEAVRRKHCLVLGSALSLGFVALRLVNGYGDPSSWSLQRDGIYTLLSFLKVSKYPPSLSYLLITLGPMLLALALFERVRGRLATMLQTLGQVPLFAYVLHIALAHLFAGLTALATGHGSLVLTHLFVDYPPTWGFGLGGVYLAWFAVLIVLYPACLWFARVKRRHRTWWLAYL